MQQFDITLVNEKERSYRLMIFFFAVLHFIFFIYLFFVEGLKKDAILGLVLMALYIIYRVLECKHNKQPFSFSPGFFWVNILAFSFFWLAVIDFVLSILSTIALQRTIFNFSKGRIETRVIPWKKYKWDEFNNVMIKDNFLTLDFKNNKLLQAKIYNTDINENTFNAFAAQQINK